MKPEYDVIRSICEMVRPALFSTTHDRSLARSRLKAIQDRIDGVFDSKELTPYGPLSDDTTTDLLFILQSQWPDEKFRA